MERWIFLLAGSLVFSLVCGTDGDNSRHVGQPSLAIEDVNYIDEKGGKAVENALENVNRTHAAIELLFLASRLAEETGLSLEMVQLSMPSYDESTVAITGEMEPEASLDDVSSINIGEVSRPDVLETGNEDAAVVRSEKESANKELGSVVNNNSNTSLFNGTATANLSGNATSILDEVDDLSSNFLSFEEWVQKKAEVQKMHPQKTESYDLTGTNKALRNRDLEYSVGEENEIDFDLFKPKQSEAVKEKTYKNRFNFASLDCAATIVKTNDGAKGSSSILVENKESYLLNQCDARDKYIIIELCEDILVDTIVLGNYEFFSSMFKRVEFYISDRYPVQEAEWKHLGVYNARNVRDAQPFYIDNPLIWARYLKIDLVSHFGNEFYCPISIVRVHGRTMMEEYKLKESEERLRDPKTVESKSVEESAKEASNQITEAKNNSTNADKCEEQQFYTEFEKFYAQLKKNESCEPTELLESTKAALKARELANNTSNATTNATLAKIALKKNEPVTQESIYKNIMKRLSLLESNASLSLLYIEEQSKLLTEAFSKLEKKQSMKFNLLVNAINDTFRGQMDDFKNTFQTFKKESTELFVGQETAREKTYQKIDRNFNRLNNQIQFQKKIVFLLFLIVVCLLIYVILTRDTFIEGEYLDEMLDEEVARYTALQQDHLQQDQQDDNLSSEIVAETDNDTNNHNAKYESPIISNSPQFTMGRSLSPVLATTGSFTNSPDHRFATVESSSSPLFKRKLKLKFSNKFGSSSSSTILLDNGYGHRKMPSNGSSTGYVSDNASEAPIDTNKRSFSGLRQEVYHDEKNQLDSLKNGKDEDFKNLITPDQSDLE